MFFSTIVFATMTTVVLGRLSGHDGHPAAGGRLSSFAQNHRRRMQVDFGFSGTTAEEVCGSVIENFYVDGFSDKFQTSCTCKPNTAGGYSVTCTDHCEYCLSETCSLFTATFELNSDLLVESVLACDLFNSQNFGRVKVCLRDDYTKTPEMVDYFVDAQKCASTEYIECPSLGWDVPRVDCSNLGFGMDMNFCEEGSITGPFGFIQAFYFSTIDDYSVGLCVPSQCQAELDTSTSCTELELSPSQSQECVDCGLDAYDFITSTDPGPNSCSEANSLVCANLNQCDNKCGSCNEKVENFYECLFGALYTRFDCDFECGTSMKGQTLEETCSSYAASMQHPNGFQSGYTCDCTGAVGDFQAICEYADTECVSSPTSSSQFAVDYTSTERVVNGEFESLDEECLYFTETCNKVCTGYDSDGSQYATIDGQRCTSMVACTDGASDFDFVLDCRNLIVSSDIINTCTGTGIQGSPFEPFTPAYYEQSVYTPGTCGSENMIPTGFASESCSVSTSACRAFADSIEHPNGFQADYICECTGTANDFRAVCEYANTECVSSPASDTQFTLDYTFTSLVVNGEFDSVEEECLYFTDTCNTVCVGVTEDGRQYATVDGQSCTSMVSCNGGNSDLDFVLDCRNLIAGSEIINSCTGDGVRGSPFEPFTPAYYEASIYTPGTCGSESNIPNGFKVESCPSPPTAPSPMDAPSPTDASLPRQTSSPAIKPVTSKKISVASIAFLLGGWFI